MGTAAKRLLPVFRSEEEEIEFWDTHDPDEYFGGPEVSLESLMAPDDVPAPEFIVSLGLTAGPGVLDAWPPLTVRFAAVPSPYQAAYDHAVLLRHEALRGMDGFELRYRSAFSSCGSSGGPPPELTVDLIVKSHVEAERIAENLKARLSSAGARPAKDGLKGRAKELTERVAGWLQARHARLISEEEAQALLRP